MQGRTPAVVRLANIGPRGDKSREWFVITHIMQRGVPLIVAAVKGGSRCNKSPDDGYGAFLCFLRDSIRVLRRKYLVLLCQD